MPAKHTHHELKVALEHSIGTQHVCKHWLSMPPMQRPAHKSHCQNQSLIINTRDNPLSTRKGFYGLYEVTEAGGLRDRGGQCRPRGPSLRALQLTSKAASNVSPVV